MDVLQLLDAGFDLERRGETEAAYRVFMQVGLADHHDAAPAGLFYAAYCLRDLGDEAGAADLFRQVISAGHHNWTIRAELSLGSMLDNNGDVAEARTHYQRLLDIAGPSDNDVTHAFIAAARLTVMLIEHGDVDGARAVSDWMTRDGRQETRLRFAFDRGRAWDERGNAAAAADCYREIVAANTSESPRAALALGRVLQNLGDHPGALAAFQIAIESGDPDEAATARAWLRHRK